MGMPSKWWFRSALACLLIVIGVLALRTDWNHAFSTDIFDLIDPDAQMDDQTRQAELVLRTQLSREILLVVVPQAALPAEARDAFVSTATQQPSFESVASLEGLQLDPDLSALLFSHRIELLFPKWLQQQRDLQGVWPMDDEALHLLANRVVDRLDDFLARPESMAYEPLLTKDPLLLIPGVMDAFEAPRTARAASPAPLVFSAKLANIPSAEGVQAQLLDDLATLQQWVRSEFGPQTQLLDTGFHRFAQESKAKIQAEILRLNLLSLGLTLLIATLFLRKVWLLLPIALVVLCSVACALVFAVQLVGTLHILALVIGSILVGVAVDYGFHILFKREELGTTSFRSTLRRIWIPLVTSCLSTVFGFLILLSNPVSAIQQVGVFVGFGLGSAMLISVLAALAFDFPGRVQWSRNLGYRVPLPFHPRWKLLRWGFAVLALLIYLGLGTDRDSIEDLQITLTDAPQQDAEIRSMLSASGVTQYWITLGSTLQQVIDRQSQLRVNPSHASQPATMQHLADLLPSTEELQDYFEFRGTNGVAFAAALREMFETRGYDADAFESFWIDWSTAMSSTATAKHWEGLYQDIAHRLNYPLDFLVNGQPGHYWGSTRVHSPTLVPIESTPYSFELAPLKSLNRAFQEYRTGVSNSLRFSLLVIALCILLVFRMRMTLRILEIPIFAALTTLALYALLGEAITFFHLIGLLLGTCIALDYAIFAAKSSGGSSPISIRASALTTLASFAALSLSHIPAVADLGSTVLLIALLGLLHTEWNLRIYHETTR